MTDHNWKEISNMVLKKLIRTYPSYSSKYINKKTCFVCTDCNLIKINKEIFIDYIELSTYEFIYCAPKKEEDIDKLQCGVRLINKVML